LEGTNVTTVVVGWVISSHKAYSEHKMQQFDLRGKPKCSENVLFHCISAACSVQKSEEKVTRVLTRKWKLISII